MSDQSPAEQELAIDLFKRSLIPLYVCLPSLIWVILDYFSTLQDEVHYVWPQRWSIGKVSYLWIRYYTILVLVFDVAQIHSFSRPGVATLSLCIAMDPIIKIVGAVLLWSVELIMQLRIYALYGCSSRIALLNGFLFVISIGFYLLLLATNTARRKSIIQDVTGLTYGCPAIHSGIEWTQWVPPSIFEGILFIFALGKTISTTSARIRKGADLTLLGIMTRDHLLYFFAITVILIFNNVMASGSAPIPWFSYAPFHASLGIMTSHMLMHLRTATSYSDSKVSVQSTNGSKTSSWLTHNIQFARTADVESRIEFGSERDSTFKSVDGQGNFAALESDVESIKFSERPQDEQWPDVLKVG